ncbi:MAG: hypothetical protein IKF90_04780 [Parasporobacterium sp.]|nr:hypothetical protein [Parasporobacterium sp.]
MVDTASGACVGKCDGGRRELACDRDCEWYCADRWCSMIWRKLAKNFLEAASNFLGDLQSFVSTSTGDRKTMFEYLNHCIRYWLHRCGATGISDYLAGIGVDIKAPKEDKDLLLTLELFVNLLYWAPKIAANAKERKNRIIMTNAVSVLMRTSSTGLMGMRR